MGIQRHCSQCLSQVLKCARRYPENSLEYPGEMKGITEAEFECNFLHRGVRKLESLRGVVHFHAHQVLIRASIVESLEESAQIRTIDMTFFGNLLEASKIHKILLYYFPGTLISIKSG